MTDEQDSLTADDELADGDGHIPFRLAPIDTRLLLSPRVLGSAASLVVASAVLVWPAPTGRVIARLVAIALIVGALSSLRHRSSSVRLRRVGMMGAFATVAAGAVLLAFPDRSTLAVVRVAGAVMVAACVCGEFRAIRTERRDRGRIALLGLLGVAGVMCLSATQGVVDTVLVAVAIVVILVSVLVLSLSLDARTEGVAGEREVVALVSDWLSERPKSADARRDLYDKIIYEGPTESVRIFRFFVLMGLSAAIASTGVIADSTAVVIGAMLVAPLMTPLMAMAISLMMGWPNRLRRSTLVALGGIAFAIGVGVVLGLVAPAVIDVTTNSQIVSRVSPTVLDLLTAIAAGAAGAYALSRRDVSDSLSGVAIAISLVPPLTVVGICWSQGEWSAGNGALLLFATNMVTILIVGGIVFVLTGVVPVRRAAENQHRVRTAIYTTLAAGVLVLGSLLINGAEITSNALQRSAVEATIVDWLSESEVHDLVLVNLDGDVIGAVVVGPSTGLPDADVLADRLAEELGRQVTIDVSHVIEESIVATSG